MSRPTDALLNRVLACSLGLLLFATSAMAGVCEAPQDNGIGGTGYQQQTLPPSDNGIGGTGALPGTERDGRPRDNGIGGTGVQPGLGKPEDKSIENGIGGTGLVAGNGMGGTGRRQLALFAGRVMFAKGSITARQPDGEPRYLKKDDPICEGDTLVVANDALAQLHMADAGRLMLHENSRVVIDTFRRPSQMDGTERFAITLVEGGLRAITGEIGKLHKENYAIATPVARIGIRGTDHEVFHVAQPSHGLAAGTYNRVLSGGTVVEAGGGKLALAPTQVGFVSPGASPTRLNGLPAMLGTTAADLLTTSRKSMPSVEDTTMDDVVQALRLSSNRVVIDFDGIEMVIAPAGSAYVGVNQLSKGHGTVLNSSIMDAALESAATLLDPLTNIPMAMADTDTGFNFFRSDAKLVHFRGALVDSAPVFWGLYAGGAEGAFQIDQETGEDHAVSAHHFIYSPGGATTMDVIQRINGTFTFDKIVGQSCLTDEHGRLGGRIHNMAVDVMFGGNPGVTRYDVHLTDAQQRDWHGSMNGFQSLTDFAVGQVQLQTSCSGKGCGVGHGTGSATGLLVGQQGKGLATGFGLTTQTGQTVNGVAVLSRP
ncbi:hypothetical protein HNQ59_002956 [Chitinivorax tropicus]|uniref:FecR protein domain-containing protein n=1 Tax=Chitinivorax tropicus TaxID=714531 RepID=A0A840MLY6_9PROT|nr:FecR family protein [Chitinivorax tropicus]MBB5019648.1 hypothetical protein [Chitinivorax tropicus]